MHHEINKVLIRNLDNTNINGLSAIDIINASYGIMDYIAGCTILEYNEII